METESADVAVLNFPAVHPRHEADVVAPTSLEYLPETHGVQTLDKVPPVVPEKVPAAQYSHQTEPDPVKYVPAGQVWHVFDSYTEEYDPGKQRVHTLWPVKLV